MENSRYKISIHHKPGTRKRIVVYDSKPEHEYSSEILALRLEPNGKWITEGTIDQSQKGSALFIAAQRDDYSSKAFTGLNISFPSDFNEAVNLSQCIAKAYKLTFVDEIS